MLRLLRNPAVRPWRLLVLLAYLGFLTWASLAPATTIAKFPLSFPYADKLFHFLIYGGLVAVARWAFAPRIDPPASGADASPVVPASQVGTRSTRVPNPSLVLTAIAYGFLMELIQSLLVSYGRSFELLDVLANTLGALTFWFLTAPRSSPR